MNMSMKDGVAGPLIVALLFLGAAGLRAHWHQSAVIPAIVAALIAIRALLNLRKRGA